MPGVSHSAVIDVPRQRVFDYVNDYNNVPGYMFGITRFDPTTDHTSGLGATFNAEMSVGPKVFKSTVETKEWVDGELIALVSVDGFPANTTWRFADADGGTKVEVEFQYKLPGGLSGRALGAILEPFVGQAIKQTDNNLRSQLV
ncbi:SRPBCC family protein [Gordonia jacobaea]|uniref:SRPBCC family protein n=1 Tax=Gordonia jacobaea TaxID=122202 RepID=UPI003D722A44